MIGGDCSAGGGRRRSEATSSESRRRAVAESTSFLYIELCSLLCAGVLLSWCE